MKFTDDYEPEYQNYELVLSNFYQIYYAMRLKAPLLMLECYLVLIDLAIEAKNYVHAQKYAEKCLVTAVFYK